MRIDLPQKIDRIKWLERLGVKGDAEPGLMQQMKQAEKKLMEVSLPHGTFKLMETGNFELPGSAIKKHLAECNGMVIMAVTLGAGVDRLIRMSQVKDMAEAVILDAGASILAEQCADIMETIICAETGEYMTGRYSPGYGDFPIEMQSALLREVDGPKTIGLTTNESHILIPRKSITAIIGTADHPVTGYMATCSECTIRDNCRLREAGIPCYK